MRFDIVTIFPDFFAGPLDYGIVRRARESGLIEVGVHDLRQFTRDRHRTVDDRPFGGGEGMVLKPEPLFEAVESLTGQSAGDASVNTPQLSGEGLRIVLLSASGKLFRQSTARDLAACDRVILLCGRYEGVDERVAEHLATAEISVGDFVLTGGELPAALIMDAVTRLLPGALGNEASSLHESFTASESSVAEASNGPEAMSAGRVCGPTLANSAPNPRNLAMLDWPHYTRPAEFRGWAVPDVLLSGNHDEIRRWRERMALEKTRRNRPDLLI